MNDNAFFAILICAIIGSCTADDISKRWRDVELKRMDSCECEHTGKVNSGVGDE